MSEKKKYMKIRGGVGYNPLFLPFTEIGIVELKDVIFQGDEGDVFSIKITTMDEEKYKNLPEWDGF